MSTHDGPLPFGSPFGGEAADGRGARLRRLAVRGPSAVLRRLAFWVAVALPFLYVPLLFSGVATPGERTALLALLCCNALALYLGHGHRPD